MAGKIKAKITAIDSNKAAHIEGDPNFDFEFDIKTLRTNKGLHVEGGVNRSLPWILGRLGLDPDTQPDELFKLLKLVEDAKDKAEVTKIVTGPKWKQYLQVSANLGTVIDNILKFKENEDISTMLAKLAEIAAEMGLPL